MALWYGWDVLMGASGVIFVIFDLLFWAHARDFDSVLKCIFWRVVCEMSVRR